MTIRTADINDAKKIYELETVCFPIAEAASLQSVTDRLTHYPDHFWILEDGDTIVSFVNGLVTDLDHLTDEMYEQAQMHNENGDWQMIFGVDTAPEYRCKGCAGKLLSHVIDEARKQHRKGLVLTCKDHLVHFYAKFGFIDLGISDSEHGGVAWHEMKLTF